MMVKTILLIDDDADDRTFFCEALEAVAPEIVCNTSSDSRKALAKLNNREIQIPDLIILDVNIPVISGWQCLSILKEHDAYKDIPVIMYSTSSYREDINKARQLGALCFFTKPDNSKDLNKSVAIIAEHLHSNSLPSLMHGSPLFLVQSQP